MDSPPASCVLIFSWTGSMDVCAYLYYGRVGGVWHEVGVGASKRVPCACAFILAMADDWYRNAGRFKLCSLQNIRHGNYRLSSAVIRRADVREYHWASVGVLSHIDSSNCRDLIRKFFHLESSVSDCTWVRGSDVFRCAIRKDVADVLDCCYWCYGGLAVTLRTSGAFICERRYYNHFTTSR